MRTTDEYSSVSALPLRLARCKSAPDVFWGPDRLVVSLAEAAEVQLCVFYLSVKHLVEVAPHSAGRQRTKRRRIQ